MSIDNYMIYIREKQLHMINDLGCKHLANIKRDTCCQSFYKRVKVTHNKYYMHISFKLDDYNYSF